MSTKAKLIIDGIIIALFIGMAAFAHHWHVSFINEQKRAETAELNLKSATATINDMQNRQREVASLDAKYQKELANAKAQNDDLQRKLDNGGRVLVKGKCSVPAAGNATPTSSLGNGSSIELTDAAGRNVLGIRAGIISDQKKVMYLQEYIRTQCK